VELAAHSVTHSKKSLQRPEAFAEIITKNEKMLEIFLHVESIARTSEPVLITGETGVGKELIARAIAVLSGLRGPFVPVNVAGLDDNVFSDTLFGHVRGAFTGAEKIRRGLVEYATAGTLFLDEIGELSAASQVKLLRLLQEAEYLPLGCDQPRRANVRILAATNEDLWALQAAGEFRKDLNFRIRTHHVHVPPLRERLEDLPLLMDHFLEKASSELKKRKPTPPKELVTLLSTYAFPGNIRELRSMIFDAVSRHSARILSLDSFKSHISQWQAGKIKTRDSNLGEEGLLTFSGRLPTIKEATQLLIAESMRRAKGNITIAAGMLGISRQALSKRLNKGNSGPGDQNEP